MVGSAKEGENREPSSNYTRSNDDFEEARDQFDEGLAPPQPSFTSKKAGNESSSPHRDSKFVEGF